MATVFKLRLTELGLAAFIDDSNIGTAAMQITTIALGSGSYDPTGTETALQTPIKTLTTIGGSAVAGNIIHVSISDDSADTYSVGEIGLINGDGVLVAVSSSAAMPVITTKGENDVLYIPIQMIFTEIDVTDITFGDTFFEFPAATESVPGVMAYATAAEIAAGTVADKAITPAALGAANSVEDTSVVKITSLINSYASTSTTAPPTANALRLLAESIASVVTYDLANRPYIISQGRGSDGSSKSSYIKWSNGFIEQWGDAWVGTSGTQKSSDRTITMPYSMGNTDYNVTLTQFIDSSNDLSGCHLRYISSATTFRVRTSGHHVMWRAIGNIDEDESGGSTHAGTNIPNLGNAT